MFQKNISTDKASSQDPTVITMLSVVTLPGSSG